MAPRPPGLSAPPKNKVAGSFAGAKLCTIFDPFNTTQRHDTMKTPTTAEVFAMLKKNGFRKNDRNDCLDRTNSDTDTKFRVHVTDEGSPAEYLRVEIMVETVNGGFETIITLQGLACTVPIIEAMVWKAASEVVYSWRAKDPMRKGIVARALRG